MEALGLLKWALTLPVLKPFSIETGQHPAISAVAQAIRPEEDGFLGLTEPLFTQARSRPSLPDYARVSEQIQEMVEICLTQQLPIEAVLRSTAERISGITGLPIA